MDNEFIEALAKMTADTIKDIIEQQNEQSVAYEQQRIDQLNVIKKPMIDQIIAAIDPKHYFDWHLRSEIKQNPQSVVSMHHVFELTLKETNGTYEMRTHVTLEHHTQRAFTYDFTQETYAHLLYALLLQLQANTNTPIMYDVIDTLKHNLGKHYPARFNDTLYRNTRYILTMPQHTQDPNYHLIDTQRRLDLLICTDDVTLRGDDDTLCLTELLTLQNVENIIQYAWLVRDVDPETQPMH